MAEVQQVQTLPAPYIEALGKTYGEQLTSLTGKPIDTTQFAQQVAPESQFTQQAQGLAGGLGTYQPFLQGAAALSSPTAYQQFMSPYQQDVINTTLQQYDIQAQKGLPALAAQAIGAGAFGGGREGVQRAEYQSQSDINRAQLLANLQQQNYGQAQQLAQQAFNQQTGLAQLAPGLYAQQISGLGALGAQQQAQQQAQLEAARQNAYTAAYEPYQRLGTLGSGIAQLISGYPAREQTQITPSPSGLQTALGAASTLAGIYRSLNPQPLFAAPTK